MFTYTGILLASSLLLADDNAVASASPMPDEIAQELDYFVGDWRLVGEGAKGPMKSSWSMRWAPGKHCLVIKYRRREEGKTIHGNALWGWDSASGEMVYHALFSDRGLEHIRTKIVKRGVFKGRYQGSLEGKEFDGAAELRKEGPDQWTFKTTGAAPEGTAELDVRFTRVASADKAATETSSEIDKDSPWELVTGHWRLSDATGYTGDVVWKSAGDHALIGTWQDEDGTAVELAGWRPDKKVFLSTGYGANGSYWEVTFTKVTQSMIKGKMTNRKPDGSVMIGTWQVKKKNDNEMPTLFVGTQDGEKVTIKGSFKRVK